jgi:hypothetical protein
MITVKGKNKPKHNKNKALKRRKRGRYYDVQF